MIPGQAQQFFEAAAAQSGGDFEVLRSLRFNSADSAYLDKTFSSAGDQRTWTWSGWFKRQETESMTNILFASYTDNSNRFYIGIQGNSDKLLMFGRVGGSDTLEILSDQVFRDFSAWYHMVVAIDSTQSSSSDRVKVYVNGSQISLSTTTALAQNAQTYINAAASHRIGNLDGSSLFNGYQAQVNFIDGQALAPTEFGETDDNNNWNPKDTSGLTFGTNGFYLKFADNSSNAALGTDSSGNGNTWTVNNISSFNGTVAAADGALPILNTSGDFGDTVESGTRTDSNSSSIVLALPLNGANGGTTWSDYSATIKGSGSAKTITANNDVETSTTESFFYGSSTYFDGSGDRLVLGNASDLSFTGDFTVETWLYLPDSTTIGYPNGDRQIIGVWTGSNNDWLMTYSGTGSHNTFLFQIYTGGGTTFFSSGVDMSNYVRKWVHLAAVRNSGSIQLYVDGVASGGTHSNSDSFGQSSNVAVGGRVGADANSVKGYLSDTRIYLSAKYTSNFNPPSRTASGNDSLIDTPLAYEADSGNNGGNYATLNPLNLHSSSNDALSNGNLECSMGSGSAGLTPSTIGFSSGKFYYEVVFSGSVEFLAGIRRSDSRNYDNSYTYHANGNKYTNGGSATSYGASFTDNDIIGVAVDMDAGTLTFYKNGVSQGQAFSGISGTYTFIQGKYSGSGGSYIVNFGQRPFSYTPPTDHLSLCTQNLADPTIAEGSTAMDVVTYAGNASTQTISGLGFSPDFIWIKERTDTGGVSHYLGDTVRGVNKDMASNSTSAEGTDNIYGYISAATSDGFTVTAGSSDSFYTNGNPETYVAWTWDAGTSTASNTDGTITTQVRANQSVGFSIATYSGTGSNATFGHGLNAVPELVIVKSRSNSQNWAVQHAAEGPTKYAYLNSSNEFRSTSGTAFWNDTAPTTSVVSVGTDNDTNNGSQTYVSYCFAPVEGYSAFGSYTGNGSTDGPFVYTGFRPAFVMLKRTDSASSWQIRDTTRSPSNVVTENLYPNLNNAESTSSSLNLDILSNGFKPRTSTDGGSNASGGTYVYACFSEHPFKTARAR